MNRNGAAMCEKCSEIDKKIEHYKTMQSRVLDKLALEGIAELIARLMALKGELHLESDDKTAS
ncbi:hypothetical protein [Bradyrhizobium liaoningense]|uniref:hypothetical protein n=1 Tax=Bradyrhizobium liaoningense TaxID=43992 RepID=UPI001BAD80C9|nr:hypothetical protein [Bradyrhizobium liaoningense]MBR0908050.1 hypothetical protein [Bradyrhizobium liaoningense]